MLTLRVSFTQWSATLWRGHSAGMREMQAIALPPVCFTLIEHPPGRSRHI